MYRITVRKCKKMYRITVRKRKKMYRITVRKRKKTKQTDSESRLHFFAERAGICCGALQQNCAYPDASYPDRLGPSGKFVENSTKLTFLETADYRVSYGTVLWLLELQISRGRKVQTPVHTVNSNSRTANCQCSVFSNKNPIIQTFWIPGRLSVPILLYCK